MWKELTSFCHPVFVGLSSWYSRKLIKYACPYTQLHYLSKNNSPSLKPLNGYRPPAKLETKTLDIVSINFKNNITRNIFTWEDTSKYLEEISTIRSDHSDWSIKWTLFCFNKHWGSVTMISMIWWCKPVNHQHHDHDDVVWRMMEGMRLSIS